MFQKASSILSADVDDVMSTAVLVLNDLFSIVKMNVAAENLFGLSHERVIGKPFTVILDQELHKDEIQQALDIVVENREAHALRACQLLNKQDRETTVDLVINPVLKGNTLNGLVLEFYRTEHQLKIAREEQIKSQQEAAQQLVRSMAHEIKNPLGGLRGAAQLLESEIGDNSLKEYTSIIIAEADRLTNLVDRMLGTRKPNENKLINIHEVLEHVRHLVNSDIPEGVEISFDYDPSIPLFQADLDNLIQIVLNIVVNALKAVKEGGNIEFKTRIKRNHIINHVQYKLALCLEIKDNGVGVPEDIKDKLFFPMISGSDVGSGLGLSIAQSLAHRQNGSIEFVSSPGDTRFTLFLPIDSITAH